VYNSKQQECKTTEEQHPTPCKIVKKPKESKAQSVYMDYVCQSQRKNGETKKGNRKNGENEEKDKMGKNDSGKSGCEWVVVKQNSR
jgi:hypothetical protein